MGRFVTTLGGLGLLTALASSGCTPKSDTYGCAPVEPVGGDVVGTWGASNYCTVKYDRVVSADWCSQLIFDGNGVRQAYLGHPWMKLNPGSTLKLTEGPSIEDPNRIDRKYESVLKFSTKKSPDAIDDEADKTETVFPKECITAYGQAAGDCSVFAAALDMWLSDPSNAVQSFRLTPLALVPTYPFGLVPQPTYSEIICDNGANGACDCKYHVTFEVPDRGQWTKDASGTVLSLYSDTSALPYDNDFAVGGTELDMSGHGGFDILGVYGLRSMGWTKQ